MELRFHGRGGQGAVTCAKILAYVYAQLGKSVQAFGDYAGERSGAPVRAFTRVSDTPVTNRNKVVAPDHLVVLDATLLELDVLTGLRPGGLLIINSPEPLSSFSGSFRAFRLVVLDATAIARAHGIGTRSLVIVNTTMAGALARALGIDFDVLAAVYDKLGFGANAAAAREAFDATQILEPSEQAHAAPTTEQADLPTVLPLTDHREGPPTGLATGSWRTQVPAYVTRTAPCNNACPAGNDVVGFLQAVAREEQHLATQILRTTTPFASVCGRVCPAPCMDGCNRIGYDGAVNVRALERWIGDRAEAAAAPEPQPHMIRKSIAVVGSGPAGLAAAYHIAVRGHEATVFEREPKLGGILRTGIPTFRLPRDVLDREVDAIVQTGVKIECNRPMTPESIAALTTTYDGVILATGLQKLRRLSIPGADLEGAEQGTDFLHRLHMSERPTVGKQVVVVGGGNTAIDCARSALRLGAKDVSIVYRRTREEMPAIAEEIEQALEEGVRILFQRQPLAVLGEGSVRGMRLAEVDMGEPDSSGRRRPVVSDRTLEVSCDTILLALGQSADLSLVPKTWQVVEGRAHEDDVPLPVFLAGDLATNDGTVAHAIGDGNRAAAHALGELVATSSTNGTEPVAASEVRFDHFTPCSQTQEHCESPSTRIGHFDELNAGLPNHHEAKRCLACGHCTSCDTCLVYCPEGVIERDAKGCYVVDLTYCKGCGVCVSECPRGAMEMKLS